MIIPETSHCCRCIDRHIVTGIRILDVISDPTNSAGERSRLVEMLRERERLMEEKVMTRPPMFEDDAAPDLSGIKVGDRVTCKFRSCPKDIEGAVLEVNADTGWICVKQGGGQYGGRAERVEKVVKQA